MWINARVFGCSFLQIFAQFFSVVRNLMSFIKINAPISFALNKSLPLEEAIGNSARMSGMQMQLKLNFMQCIQIIMMLRRTLLGHINCEHWLFTKVHANSRIDRYFNIHLKLPIEVTSFERCIFCPFLFSFASNAWIYFHIECAVELRIQVKNFAENNFREQTCSEMHKLWLMLWCLCPGIIISHSKIGEA